MSRVWYQVALITSMMNERILCLGGGFHNPFAVAIVLSVTKLVEGVMSLKGFNRA
ncbi:MAG: hypothetical protein U5M23_06450 [Marinagarivorans sp.]|nr:hypothetical protein [Marinagarivorans sp.]